MGCGHDTEKCLLTEIGKFVETKKMYFTEMGKDMEESVESSVKKLEFVMAVLCSFAV